MMLGLSTLNNPLAWFIDWLRGGDGSDDAPVSTADALSLPAVWNGVSRIAGHVSQLPVHVYETIYGEDGERTGGRKDRTHDAYRLMMRRPNQYQTPIVFREQLALHSLLDGNGRAAIVMSGSRPIELLPMLPEWTATGMMDGEKFHACRPPASDRLRQFFGDPENPNSLIVLTDREVLHVPGLSADGISGIPLRSVARRNLSLAIAIEKRLNAQLQKGFSSGLMLEAPAGMFRNAKDAEEFLDLFESRHNSPEKAGKVGLLREGMKANLLAQNNKDAELAEQRKFARQDAALLLGLEQILGDDSSVSYNSLEQKILAYLMNCLNRWLVRWEQECEYKLLREREFNNETHYIRYNTAALLKSDYQSTVESLAQAVAATIISPNEARSKLDMNPRDGGDTFANPAITPGDATQSENDDDNSEEGTQSAVATAEPRIDSAHDVRATQMMLANLVSVEVKRANSFAGAKNFVAAVDRFYSKWETKLADTIESLGGDRDQATAHCNESKRVLLACADQANNASDLQKYIQGITATWASRAQSLADEITLTAV